MIRYLKTWWAVVILAAAAAPLAWSSTAAPAGFYSSVEIGQETGDESGLRIELHYATGKPRVTFWMCEGECLEKEIHGLSIVGAKIVFVVHDVMVLPGGKRVTHLRRFAGTFGPGGLSIASPGFWKTERLKGPLAMH